MISKEAVALRRKSVKERMHFLQLTLKARKISRARTQLTLNGCWAKNCCQALSPTVGDVKKQKPKESQIKRHQVSAAEEAVEEAVEEAEEEEDAAAATTTTKTAALLISLPQRQSFTGGCDASSLFPIFFFFLFHINLNT